MTKIKDVILYRFSLIIVGTSVFNLGINTYYVRKRVMDRIRGVDNNRSIVDELFKESPMKEHRLSQMQKLKKQTTVDVAIVKNKAYWVQDNVLYQTNIHSSGEILTDEAEPVDVINMPEKQLKHIIEIVDSFNK